jgi:hypothetical protein
VGRAELGRSEHGQPVHTLTLGFSSVPDPARHHALGFSHFDDRIVKKQVPFAPWADFFDAAGKNSEIGGGFGLPMVMSLI